MKQLIIKGSDNPHRYPEDIKRLEQILFKNGFICSEKDCDELWSRHSDSMCAGWMSMGIYNDEELFNCVLEYIENK